MSVKFQDCSINYSAVKTEICQVSGVNYIQLREGQMPNNGILTRSLDRCLDSSGPELSRCN